MTRYVKYAIWLYFILLIFEGALRKWVFPQLSNALLVVRDPLVLLIYLMALAQKQFPWRNGYVICAIALSALSGMSALLLGHENLFVMLYGMRANFMQIPLIFIIPKYFDKTDVLRIGLFTLVLSIPMTILIALQFNLPQTAWVNLTVGGKIGAGFSGALGYSRPPGTFSFITGVVSFYTLVSAFALYGWAHRKTFPLWILLPATITLFIAQPISISRSLVLGSGLVLVATIYALVLSKQASKQLLRMLIVSLIAVAVVSQFDVFQTGLAAFSDRWERSTGEEKGGVKEAIVVRFFSDLYKPLLNIEKHSLTGRGLGAGTIAGAKMLENKQDFLGGEGEWSRLLYELGIPLGLVFILMRLRMTMQMAFYTHRFIRKKHVLPWILFSTVAIAILTGQWGQPTLLGFIIFTAGLTLSATRTEEKKKPVPTEEPQTE